MEKIIIEWLHTMHEDLIMKKKKVGIHIDELFPQHVFKNKKNIIYFSIDVFDIVSAEVEKLNLPLDYQIDLQIELMSGSKKLKKVPEDEKKLIASIDDKSSPEMTIFYPGKEYWKPQIEMYSCPIYFSSEKKEKDSFWLYQEYRTIDDLIDNEVYSRWLTISYFSWESLRQ